MAQNTLMFQVGIDSAIENAKVLDDLLAKVKTIQGAMQIKVQVEGLEGLTTVLKDLGDGKQLKPLLDRIEKLNTQLDVIGVDGERSIARLKKQYDDATKAVDEYNKKVAQMESNVSGAKVGTPARKRFEDVLSEYKKNNDIDALLERQGKASTNLAAAQENVAKTAQAAAAALQGVGQGQKIDEVRGKVDAFAESLKKLTESGVGGTIKVTGFSDLTEQIKSLVTNVQNLINEWKALNQVQQQGGNISPIKSQTEALQQEGAQAQKTGQQIENLAKKEQEVAQAQQKSGQSNLFDPQKITTLQEAIDKIIGEINRMKAAFENLGQSDGLKNLGTNIKGITDAVETLKGTLSTLSNGIKFTGSSDEITNLTSRIETLKKEIEQLETKAKQASDGIKTIASGKGSEATQNTNLDALKVQMDKVYEALSKMGAEYSKLEQAGIKDAGTEQRINKLREYYEWLQKVANMDLSKAGSLKSVEMMFDGNLLFGQKNKQMYSDKAVKEFAKMVDEALKGKEAMDAFAEAINRANLKMLGMGSSATGGMRGVATMMESINTVGERNIQTLIKEQAHIERLIAVAEKSIKFGEGHDIAGMSSLRSQQKANLEYLNNVRDAIRYILENRNVPEWMRFLNTPGALRIPLPGSGNDVALLGGHFDKLTHSVTGTSQAMHKLQTEMQLGNNNEYYKNWNTQNLTRGLYNVEQAIERIKEQWARMGDGADIATQRAVSSMLNGLNDLRGRISSAMQNDDLLRSHRGFGTVMNADYDIQLKNAKRVRDALKQQADADEKAINTRLKAEERASAARVAARANEEKNYEKVWLKGLAEREKATQKAAQTEKKSLEDSQTQYNRLEGVLRRLNALKESAANAKVDTTWIDSLAGRLKIIQDAYSAIISGKGKDSRGLMFGDIKDSSVTRSAMLEVGQVFTEINKQIRANEKAERDYMKEVERFTEQSKKSYAQAEKEKEKAAKERQKAVSEAEKKVQAEIDKTNSLMLKNNAAITRGAAAGRDMTSLKSQNTALEQQINLLDALKNSLSNGRVDPSSPMIDKRIKDIALLREDTELLRKAEEKLNTARESYNKKQYNSGIKNLQDEEKSVRDAWNRYDELKRKIAEVEALKARGEALKMDVSGIDNALARLRDLKAIMSEIIANGGRSSSSYGRAASGSLAKDFWAAQGKSTRGEIGDSIKAFNKELTQTEAQSRAASADIRKLGMSFNELKGYMKANGGSEEMRKLQGEIQGAIQKMRQLMNAGDYAGASRVFERVSASAKRATAATREYETAEQRAANATYQLSDSEQRLANAVHGSTDAMRSQSQVLSDLKMMAMQYLSVWGAQSFINKIIETGGQLEQQRLSLSAILGDMDKATELFGQIKQLALKSPFGVVELDKMSKQLAAYSFEYEELFDWTKRLADISAATGTSVDRLALALGHVRSEGALSGYTLRQFAMANVPVLRMLSENLGISSKEVRERVKKKEISSDDVQDILRQLTDDGGMFANAQETMSEALNAKFKNLRDAFDIMYGEIAEGGVGDALKELAGVLTSGAKHWERLGKDMLGVAAAFGVGKAAILLYNNAIGQGTVATLRSAVAAKEREVANLKLASSYRTLTTAEQFDVDTQRKLWKMGGSLNSRNIATLLSTKKLTVAELERAVALGKVDKATALAAMRLNNLNTQTMANVTVLKGWSKAWAMISYNVRLAGLAIKSMIASVAPLLALTAAFEVWFRRSEQEDAARGTASAMAGVAPGREANELYGNLGDSRKLSDEALKSNIEEMKEALKAAGAYTKELQKQVDAIKDAAGKYDLLKEKVGEVSAKYEEMKRTQESTMNDALDAGGGLLSDNMLEDAKDYDTAFTEYTKTLTVGSKQIKEALKEWMKGQGLWSETFADMTGKQIFEQLSADNQQSFLNYGWNATNLDEGVQEAIRNISIAHAKVGDAFKEMNGEQGREFADLMRATYEEAFKVDLSKASDEQKIAFDKWLRETISRAEGLSKDAKDALRNIVIDFTIKLVPHYQVGKPQTAQDVIDEQIGDNKWLSGFFGRQEGDAPKVWTVETAQKEVKKYKKLFGDISLSNLDTAPKKINSLLDGLEETKKNLKNTLSNGLLGQEEKESIQKSLDETTESIDMANKALKDVGGKRERKGDKSKNKGEDVNAKAVRERVRVIKEAADAYQYWRDKVGDQSAWAHVQSEFGDVLNTIGITADNIDNVRAQLNNIPNTKEYKAIRDKKVKTEIDKEIAKENDQFIRKDFEKDTENFLSNTQKQLNDLTRAWDMFNSVRESTGDLELAVRISGVGGDGTRNLADDLKKKIESDFASLGSQGIAFDVNMSDKQIKENIEKAVPQGTESVVEYEKHISALVEEYKKWRDLQKDVEKQDVEMFSRLIGSAVDLQSQLQKVNEEYRNQIESLNRLKAKGEISSADYNRARNIADANLQMKVVQAQQSYQFLMDGVVTMSKKAANAIKRDYIDALNKQLQAGVITAKDYADKIAEITKKMQELENAPSYLQSYTQGGLSGIFENLLSRGKSTTQQGASLYQQGAREMQQFSIGGKTFSTPNFQKMIQGNQMAKIGADMMQGAQGAMGAIGIIDTIVHGIDSIVQGLKGTFDEIREMFDALGHDVESDSWEDVNTFFSSFSAASSKATQGWDSLKSGNIGGVIEGVVGSWTSWITGFAQGHDRKREKHIQDLRKDVQKIDNTLNLIKSLRERSLGYDEGTLRRNLASQYSDYAHQIQFDLFDANIESIDGAKKAMYDYYSRGGLEGNGYSQELNALKKQREGYQKMWEEEDDKKKSSAEALEEYTSKMAELDMAIMNFTQDLANELWGIDIAGWADQIGDALWTAFENGEDAVEAFGDTAKEIVSSVAKNMWQLSVLEPLFKDLQEDIFGTLDAQTGKYSGGTIKYDTNGNIDMKASEQPTLDALGKYLGEGGIYQQAVEGGQVFYEWAKKVSGIDFDSEDESSSTSTSIKGITEQTADLLASYVNAIRADVSVDRNMIAQYLPMYGNLLTSGNNQLVSINQHVAEIERTNQIISDRITSIDNNFTGLKNKTWKMPMA